MPPQPRGRDSDLETRLAALEESLGGSAISRGSSRGATTGSGDVRSLVERAASDPDFATELLASPKEVAQEFGLSSEQGDAVALLSGQGLLASVLRSRGALPQNMRASGGGGYY